MNELIQAWRDFTKEWQTPAHQMFPPEGETGLWYFRPRFDDFMDWLAKQPNK